MNKNCFYKENGKWIIDTKVKIGSEYKHFKKGGYPTLGAARADFERARQEFINIRSADKSSVLFPCFIEEYEKMRKAIVDTSTIECDMSAFNIYILPRFRTRTVEDVFRSEEMSEWYHNLINNKQCSNNKKSKVITRMKDLLKFAYLRKYIKAEAYQDCDVQLLQVKYSKKPLVERIIWTEEEEKAFLNAISTNERDNLMFRIFLATSPRLGEFLGLQVSCFDMEHNKIVIKQQVKNIKGNGSTLVNKLKTNESYRAIIISKKLSDMLADYIIKENLKDTHYLWYCSSKNKPLSRNSIRRLFNYYCNIAGVRRMNLHALRHNQAVKLASVCHTGQEIEAAARRLGHSPSMFLNTYANHANDDVENELLRRIDDEIN